jgi:hypothetical protein
MPPPRSLAHLKREISEKTWAEARQCAGGQTSRKKYKMPAKQKPDGIVTGSSMRQASRFCQLTTGHCLTGQYLNWRKSLHTAQCCGAGARPRRETTSSRCAPFAGTRRWFCRRRSRRRRRKCKSLWKVRDLLADERCVRTVSPLRMYGDWPLVWLKTTCRVRHQSGNSGGAESQKRK